MTPVALGPGEDGHPIARDPRLDTMGRGKSTRTPLPSYRTRSSRWQDLYKTTHEFRPSPLGQVHCESSSLVSDRRHDVQAWQTQVAGFDLLQPWTQLHRSNFGINVPEHLPNSPLCPQNPRHPSGGQGICPFHGRRKSESPSTPYQVDASAFYSDPKVLD